MSISTKAWLILCAVILYSCGVWYHGYRSCDKNWQLKESERERMKSDSARKLSEEYRIKEQKLNETIGYLETKGINDSATAEMEYKTAMDRLLNAGNHPADGLRVKSALTCRAVPNNPAASSNGHEEVQAGLLAEVAGSAVGVGAECDQVVLSLNACQDYSESLRQGKEKPLD